LPQAAPRNIACLESLWHDEIDKPFTVRRILETGSAIGGFRVAHFTCNTGHELAYNFQILRRRRSYRVLYLAFHGSPGVVSLHGEDLTLEGLAGLMGTGFRGRILHFGTCATINVRESRITEFMERTGVAMVIGYGRNIDWIESASMDLLLFQWLQRYVNLRRLWTGFEKRYAGLVELTGMAAYFA
jgi:hypothetical protein